MLGRAQRDHVAGNLYLGGRSGKNRSLPRSDHAGERDRREGMFRQEGLCPVYAQKTAKALGLTISQSPLVRADQVIQ